MQIKATQRFYLTQIIMDNTEKNKQTKTHQLGKKSFYTAGGNTD